MKKVFLFLTCNVFACIVSIEKHFLLSHHADNTRPWAKKSLSRRTRYLIWNDCDWLVLRHWLKGSSFSKHRDYCFFPDYQNLPAEFAISSSYFDIWNNTCSRYKRILFESPEKNQQLQKTIKFSGGANICTVIIRKWRWTMLHAI